VLRAAITLADTVRGREVAGRVEALGFQRWLRTSGGDVRIPRGGHNRAADGVKRRHAELIGQGLKGADAARRVGVSTRCGSKWFLEAGGVMISDRGPISSRFLDQDDRIATADGLRVRRPIKQIAAEIGKSFQTV